MLINGIDITSLNIKLYDRILTSNTVKAVNEWADGSLEPYYVRSQDTFKKMTLTFLVLEPDEQEAFLKMSQLTQMLKKATIKFDDLDFQFDVVFNGTNKPSRLKNGNFLITYDLASGYARSLDREVYTTDIGATSTFRLNVVYYQNGNIFAGQDTVLIRSVSFSEQETPTLSSIGIDVDKFKDEHYKSGVASNLGLMELTYDNLQSLGVLIINYEPIQYSVEVRYIIDSGSGYQQSLQETIPFTYPQIQAMRSVGELIKVNNYRPEGYSAKILYNQGLIVENLLAASPIFVQYTHIDDDRIKNITLTYRNENDNGEYDIIESVLVSVPETRIVEGTTFEDIFNFDAWRPTPEYYHPGYIDSHNRTDFVNYDELETSYYIDYRRIEYVVYIEYYAGTYPNWYRLATSPILLKYNSSYEEDFSLENIGIDLDKYLTGNYQNGVLYNAGLYHTFDSVIEAGALQVYYVPIEYPLTIRYKKDDSNLYTEETININITQFYNQPLLGDIIDITGHKPTGYQFDPEASYKGEVSLDALTYAQPIYIIYTEIQTTRTKDIIIRYKQQLASAFSTISTAIITVSENELIGGARLKDIIDLNAHKPEYYETGILDGVSDSQVITFETLATSYSVLYYASTYYTVINYYTDDVDVRNWVGSDTINYRVIDFSADTTLIDLGLKINQYKNVFAADGIVQYRGPVNFTALRELTSIDVVYDTVSEPDEPGDIEYPHRVLFLQHNDLGGYEGQHPNWRFPHAYINTGFTCEDMSKLTVKIKCGLVDEYTPMSQVNAGYAYLFGSSSSFGEYFMRFNNQTMYGTNLSGVNTYEARAGQHSAPLVLTESNAIGWGPNSGIYSNPSADGYSVAVFNYSNRVATDHARMPFPLYLFANNNAGVYTGGLAGIEIYNCIIEYDGEVVRDLIPVQYYDKIGSQVAPSNCLYDKVSQSFFEDATGQNSFNIRDDDSYPITDPVQQIGSFYVNYYKGDYIFETRQIFYRGDEFEEEWDLDAKLEITEHQPVYYNPGKIVNLTDLGEINFENLKNFVFNVVYEEQENVIQVHYYKDTNDPANLLATESLVFTEKDFYQVPMFGELIRLNKYKPEGYETNYVFPEPKITLGRVIAHAPYDIVYTPIEGEEPTYTTNIKYIKKVFGFHTYETLGNITLTLGASDFREGEFIDYYIDWDAFKPEKYYRSGESYQWYKMDEHLYSPSKLKNEYIVCYLPTTEQIEIRYYTDDVDILNQVATTTWSVKIDDFDGPFYLVDQLPNRYVNLFKPVKCDYGVLQNTNRLYTFEELVEAGIDIVYDTIIEPGGPDAIPLNRLNKVLFWDARFGPNNINYTRSAGNQYDPLLFTKTGGRIPYIDLGYTPKELSRLTVEMKYVSKSATPLYDRQNYYSDQTLDYMGIFGYAAAFPVEVLGNLGDTSYRINNLAFDDNKNTIGRYGTGTFAFRGRVPVVRMPIVYNEYTPATWEGENYSTTYRDTKDGSLVGVVVNVNHGITKWNSSCATYRNGASTSMDENYNTVKENSNYEVQYNASIGERMSQSSFFNDIDHGSKMEMPQHALDNGFTQFDVAVPITHTLSAYRKYSTAYDFGSGNGYGYYDFSNNDDKDSFEVRCRPRGSLTLFATRNPDSGIINQNPFCHMAYPNVSGALSTMYGVPIALRQNFLNPYYAYDIQRTIETEIMLENLGTTEDTQYYTTPDGKVIPMSRKNTQSVKYSHSTSMYVGFASWRAPAEPEPTMCMVWGIKIWDKDKLVRDLVPVAKGEEIAGQIMPENGLFDLITEIFFTNCNEGGTYIGTVAETRLKDGAIMPNGVIQQGDILETSMVEEKITIPAKDVIPLMVMDDPCYFGNVGANYYDEQNNLIAQQSVAVPVWYDPNASTFAEQLHCNDFKPNDYYLNGLIDTDDPDNPYDQFQLKDIYEQGLINIYYRYRSFSKSVVYYNDNMRIGSRDLFFNLHDIEQANSITDLPIEIDYYKTDDFTNGRLIFNDTLLANNDMAAFLDAPAPVVVYDKYTKLERPDLFYAEYYRGGASEDNTITLNIDPNYLDCNLTAKVLNPTGTTKYQNHYHQAYYEDEPTDYFLPYQARINNPYVGIHYGPARRYRALAYFVHKDEVITIMEERNGWGRLKEYYHGWILLSAINRIQGPGQNPDYDPNTELDTTIPFGANLTITKLTVDRLWAYASNYDCWVKVEELSLNQSGKLYNAIGLDVIHLDEVDWNDVYILQDVVDIQKKKLRYHDFATVNHKGTITYNDMVDLHELDIVYPETIYRYKINYYNQVVDENHWLGAAILSLSISDWNPDWDHFIETSWQTNDQGEEILPELYRAAPVSLSWDFFNVGKNLFNTNNKYPDGIFLWNPHPWDDEHIYFTFEELVRTGTQKVLYPFQSPRAYKYYRYPIKSQKDTEGLILGPPTGYNTIEGVVFELEEPFINNPTNNNYPDYGSITFNGLAAYSKKDGEYNPIGGAGIYYYYPNLEQAKKDQHFQNNYISNGRRGQVGSNYYFDDDIEYMLSIHTVPKLQEIYDTRKENGLWGIFKREDKSYYRFYRSPFSPYPNTVAKIPYDNSRLPKYLMDTDDAYTPRLINSTERDFYDLKIPNYSPSGENADGYTRLCVKKGIYHGIKFYDRNNNMTAYYVPNYAGRSWVNLSHSGDFFQVLRDGFFEILNPYREDGSGKTREQDPEREYGKTYKRDYRSTINENPMEHDYNYYDDQPLIIDHYIPTTPPYTFYKTSAEIWTYHRPDELARARVKIPSGMVIPAEYYAYTKRHNTSPFTNDKWCVMDNKWYKVKLGINTSNPTDATGIAEYHPVRTDIVLRTLNNGFTPFITVIIPSTNNDISPKMTRDLYSFSNSTHKKEIVRVCAEAYFSNDDKYYYLLDNFDCWICRDDTYIDRIPVNQLYVVANDSVNYYEYPIKDANDTYKLGRYLAGDRVYITEKTKRDTNWLRTSLGWVYYEDGNLSLVE